MTRSGWKLSDLLLAAWVATPLVASANLVQNPSFAQNFASWSQPGAPAVGYSIVVSSRDGSNAARVDNRAQRDDAPRQNVLIALQSVAPGTNWTTRFWSSADSPLSVRCYLNLNDATGARSILLAEHVLRSATTWEQVEGTTRIDWSAPLTSANLSFRFDKLGETTFPGITLDDVSLDPDADSDLLLDGEETQLGTDPSQADSDADTLPDGWESRNGTDPLLDDAAGDVDSDCFTNREEYWAASDPQDPGRYPGRPSNPALSPTAQSVLRYLALSPSTSNTLIGQHLSYPAPPQDEYVSFITALNTATNRWPALLALQYDDNGNPVQVAAVNPYAINWWNAGGLVQIKWNPLNPWTGQFYGDRTFVSFAEVITTGTIANTNYMAQLVQVGDGLTELRDAGVVVLWRVCSEMNGAWFWWGRRDRQGYVDFWHHMVDYLVNQRGLNNLIWVYESDSGVHLAAASDYYFPGDDVVDVVGHNLYDNTWNLPFDAELLYRQYGKVYAVPQAGPGDLRDGSWSNLVYLDGQPTGSGGILNRLPRLAYLGAWNSFWTWDPVLQQSVYRSLAIVDNQNAIELMTDPRITTRDDLDLTCAVPGRVWPLLAVKASGNSAIDFSWSDVTGTAHYEVVEDGIPAGPFATRTGVALDGVNGLQIPLPPGDTYYRVAGCNACGLGAVD